MTAKTIIVTKPKHCPACSKLVELGTPAILIHRVSGTSGRPARARSELYHPECLHVTGPTGRGS